MRYNMLFGSANANVGTSLETIKKGDILFLNGISHAAVKSTDTVTDVPNMVIVGCIEDGKPITLGAGFDFSRLTKLVGVKHSSYVAPAYKKAVFGYDRVGDSGSFTVTSTSTIARNFKFLATIDDTLRVFRNREERYEAYHYVHPNIAVDKYAMLNDFCKQVNGPHSANPTVVDLSQPILIRVTASESGATNITGTVTCQKGARSVVCSGVPAFAVGNYLILDKVAYKVDGISDKVVTLDRAFTEESKVFATTEAKYNTSVATIGLELEEQAVPRIDVMSAPASHPFNVAVISEESMQPIFPKTLTESQVGLGTDWDIEMREYRAMNAMVKADMRNKLRRSYPLQRVIGETYDVIELDFVNFEPEANHTVAEEPVQIQLAIPNGSAQIAAIKAQLAKIVESVGLKF